MAAFGQGNSTMLRKLYSPVKGQLGCRTGRWVQKRATRCVLSVGIPHLALPTAVFMSISLSFGGNQ